MLDEREVRIQKLEALKGEGVNPYPSIAERTETCVDTRAHFDAWSNEGRILMLTGRVMVTRVHGAMIFADLRDASGELQIQLTQDRSGEEAFNRFRDRIDPGDIIEVRGSLFKTKRGEETVAVTEWRLLAKALRPLPEKWHGLKDIEIRYRDRELDLIATEETRRTFHIRTNVIRALRAALDAEGFKEVETPVLQAIPGGATARPFLTHHNALDHDFYLRIAPELYLKRCVVGGYEKVYELGRLFRNEGIDWSHNPEFTSLEFYWAYQDYQGLMTFTEKLLPTVIQEVLGSRTVLFDGHEIDFTAPWPRETFRNAIKSRCGVDIEGLDREALLREMKHLKVDTDYETADLGKLYDELYKDVVRKQQIQPLIIVDYPIEMEPLAKKCEDNPRYVQRFQVLAGGIELLKAYSELNDPIDQMERFRAQQALRESGDDEAQHIDMAFVRALEQGMPPTAGWGMGIDRFVMMLANQKSVKDVILFPTLRPEGSDEPKKKIQTMVAHAVLLHRADIPAWSKLNAAAHLAASFAAREGRDLIDIDTTTTKNGVSIPMNIRHAIMMKETGDRDALWTLKRDAEARGLHVTCFTEEMRDSTNDKKVKEWQEGKTSDEIGLLGVLVFGPKKAVEELTEPFSLSG